MPANNCSLGFSTGFAVMITNVWDNTNIPDFRFQMRFQKKSVEHLRKLVIPWDLLYGIATLPNIL